MLPSIPRQPRLPGEAAYAEHLVDESSAGRDGFVIESTLEALDRLVGDGKVREVGCCNFTAHMLDTATGAARRSSLPAFRSTQIQYSLLERPPADVLGAAEQNDMVILAYFPLASGLLTGKYRRGEPLPSDSRLGSDGVVSTMLRQGIMARWPPLSDERLATVERLSEFAAERGHSLLELAVSWLAAQPLVASVIAGVTKAEQAVANAGAADWELTAEDLAAVEAIVAQEGAVSDGRVE
jgi:aryl-alcohol dehydrogenase-like predicted oxidoreductase